MKSPFTTKWLVHYASQPPGAYRRVKIRQPLGAFVEAFEPEPQLTRIQRWIAEEVISTLPRHEADQPSHRTHAMMHAGAEGILSFDLVEVPLEAVQAALRSLRDHRLIEKLCTYRGRLLPGPSPVWPVLVAAALFPVDETMADLAGQLGANYSRYITNLVFSWQSVGPAAIQAAKNAASAVLGAHDCRYCGPHGRQLVAGLVVNRPEPGRSPVRAPRETWRALRAGTFNLTRCIKERGWTRQASDRWTELRALAGELQVIEGCKAEPFVQHLEDLVRTE